MGRNRAGSNFAVHFDFFPCRIFLSVDGSHLRRNKASKAIIKVKIAVRIII